MHSVNESFDLKDVGVEYELGLCHLPSAPATRLSRLNDVAGSIAICGVGLRLPGDINDTESLWTTLRDSGDTRCLVPASRYQADGFSDRFGDKGAIKTQYGHFISQDVSTFDPSLFSISHAEAEKTDPQLRMLLEVVKECFENAGETEYRGTSIGCYVGTFGEDWLRALSKDNQHNGSYVMVGQCDLMLANRVSYENDLRGPSMVIKTGCSSSLVALHEACRAIKLGDSEGAIVAGTNLIMGPDLTAEMTTAGILSPDGSCKTFDAAANGYARAEAITAVYLQRLDRAIAKGLPIRAVIANTGTNSDGRSQSLLQPSPVAQAELIRKVHRDAGLDPLRTAFVECHGTGTPTGDPLETKAVGEVFKPRGVYIGSVKPNLGHSEGASGLTSVLKCLVMLENNTILPNIKFNTPNPEIDFDGLKLRVPQKLEAWPADRDARVGINSFGIGGSNAHALLEHPYLRMSQIQNVPRVIRVPNSSPQLLVFSAGTEESLSIGLAKHREYIASRPFTLCDLAHTLSRHREHYQYRAFAICSGGSDFEISSVVRKPRERPDVCMVFSGQGAQWALMGQDLIDRDYEFSSDIHRMDNILKNVKHAPDWTIRDELTKPLAKSRIHHAEISQPLCTALQIALVRFLARQGVCPDAVVGHSSGEIAAAFAAGHLSMEQAIIIAYYRGYIFRGEESTSRGAMAAVGLGASELKSHLREGVVIACENSPGSSTISGDKLALELMLKDLQLLRPHVSQRLLKVDVAYHSHLIESVGAEYQTLLQTELGRTESILNTREIPMYSSVSTESVRPLSTSAPEYWVRNLLSPVKFLGAVSTMLSSHPNNVTLEIGPHAVLAAPLRQIYADVHMPLVHTSALLRSTNARQSMLTCFGKLYQYGISFHFDRLIEPGQVLANLPGYSWDHSASYWYESRLSKEWRARKFGHHELLGQRLPGTSPDAMVWRVVLDLEDLPWLSDHKIKRDTVYPFACYALMAIEALGQAVGRIDQSCLLRDICVEKAMVLSSKRPLEVVTTLIPRTTGESATKKSFDFKISSCDETNWIQHCKGRVETSSEAQQAWNTTDSYSRSVSTESWYKSLERLGLVFGPSFRLLKSMKVSPVDRCAFSAISDPLPNRGDSCLPAAEVLDANIQLALVAMTHGLTRNVKNLMVPVSVKEIQVFPLPSGCQLVNFCSETEGEMSVSCTTSVGRPHIKLTGLQFAVLDEDHTLSQQDDHGAACLEWVPDVRFQNAQLPLKSPLTPDHEKLLLEELALLCVSESLDRLRDLKPSKSHFEKYYQWLQTTMLQASDGQHPVLQNTEFLTELTATARRSLIGKHVDQLVTTTTMGAAAECIGQVCHNITSIFTGELDVFQLLTMENRLSRIYDTWSFDHGDYVQLLADQNPTLRVLEVGAGTGGTTETILRTLNRRSGFRSYSSYTFTDVSAGFFRQAKERFAYAAGVEYKVLDVSKNPLEQGFEAGQYDLIIAANVIHATPSLSATLKHLYALLATNGQLLLSEACPGFGAFNFIFGTFPGWWLGGDDGRPQGPCVSVDRWKYELNHAGFDRDCDVVYDSDGAYPWCAAIVAHKKPHIASSENVVTILSRDPNAQHCLSIIKALEKEDKRWKILDFNDHQYATGDCIVTVDLEVPLFKDLNETSFRSFKEMCQNLGQRNLLWLMSPTQVDCVDPNGSQALGVIRTARCEMDISITTLEVLAGEAMLGSTTVKLLASMNATQSDKGLFRDTEYVFHDGCLKIGRYRPIRLQELPMTTFQMSPICEDDQSGLSMKIDPTVTYMITGGFGGIGIAAARWFVEQGARSMIFLSRNAGTSEDHRSIIDEFDSMGCRLIAVRGEVQNLDDVQRAIEVAPSPIRGVIHLAMVLRDAMLVDLEIGDWKCVVDPKVQGAWNLHRSLGHSLDFFVMASSICTVTYQPGQSNYCAANVFLESFCQYRHSQGLPASVISICPVEDIGVVARNRDVRSKLRAQGYWFVDEHALIQFIALAISRSHRDRPKSILRESSEPWCNKSHLIMGLKSGLALSNAKNRATWRYDRRMGTYHNTSEGTAGLGSDMDPIQNLLTSFTENLGTQLSISAAADLLSKEIGRQLLAFLMQPYEDLSPTTSLIRLGVDSLMAVELRRWLKQSLKLDVSVIEIMSSATLGNLATVAAEELVRELESTN